MKHFFVRLSEPLATYNVCIKAEDAIHARAKLHAEFPFAKIVYIEL